MQMVSIIAAIDEAGGLGMTNKLLCHLPADLHYFKSITLGKPIIMGRKTFSSIGKPLPGRLNIVLSRTQTAIDGVFVCDSIENALLETKESAEIMIIGGAELYSEMISKVNRLYITRIHHQFQADVFFPKIDESIWCVKNKEFRRRDEKNKYDITFYMYEKNV